MRVMLIFMIVTWAVDGRGRALRIVGFVPTHSNFY